jgi:hypothetical protein
MMLAVCAVSGNEWKDELNRSHHAYQSMSEQWRFDESGNPVLEQFSEEGFVDCVLRIADLVESEEFYSFHLSAVSENGVLGMDVAVRKDINAGFDAEMNLAKGRVYRNGVIFIRSGEESDRLIARLASLYGLPDGERRMVAQETFTAIALHQGEIDLRAQAVKIKIFGRDQEPIDEEAYNESFFNLDLTNGFVFWNEKDQEYREPLIRGLTA